MRTKWETGGMAARRARPLLSTSKDEISRMLHSISLKKKTKEIFAIHIICADILRRIRSREKSEGVIRLVKLIKESNTIGEGI